MDVYVIAGIAAGAALLVLVVLVATTVVRLRRLARSAGSLRAGVDAVTTPLALAAAAITDRSARTSHRAD